VTATDTSPAEPPTGAGPWIERRLASNTGYLAHLASLRAEQFTRTLLPPGRDARDLAVLSVLAEGTVSQARLGDLLDVNRTVMITVIDRLERAGLVLRERDPADRRRYALRITPDGVSMLGMMLESARQADARLLAPLPPADQVPLNSALGRIGEEPTWRPPAALGELTGFLLGRAARRLRAQREQAMRELGIEPRCVRMLVPLDSAQPCTQEQLASRMGVTSPTIMPSVDELHDSGLITRDRNPGDRREHVLQLTGEGRAYLSRALKAEDDAQERLAARLGPAETGRLNALLTLIITA
jgi:DNA-binding MarR family transcriptional regulator